MHEETVRIVDAQMNDMGKQMGALDDFVAKARSQNGRFHEAHLDSLNNMASNVRQSYSTVQEQLGGFGERVDQLQNDTAQDKDSLLEAAAPLTDQVRNPLSELRTNIQARPLKEYVATGLTPVKRPYEYPATLPQTESHETLVARLRNSKDEVGTESPAPIPAPVTATPSNTGLREVDANVVARPTDEVTLGRSSSVKPLDSEGEHHRPELTSSDEPSSKRHCSAAAVADSKLPHKALSRKMAGMMEGRENVAPSPATRASRRLRGRPSMTG